MEQLHPNSGEIMLSEDLFLVSNNGSVLKIESRSYDCELSLNGAEYPDVTTIEVEGELRSLELTGFAKLKDVEVPCVEELNYLTVVDCPELTCIICIANRVEVVNCPHYNLDVFDRESLTISGVTSLTQLSVYGEVNSVTVEDCSNLESFDISEAGYDCELCIDNCPKLNSLDISARLESLSITNCPSLEKMSTTTLNGANLDLPNLKKVVFTQPCSIPSRVFSECPNLEIVKTAYDIRDDFSGLIGYEDFDDEIYIESSAFEGLQNLKSVVIPYEAAYIAESAFAGCTSLQKVIIREGLSSIGDSAFEGCISLKSVSIPESVEEIGYHAFADCTNLTKVEGLGYVDYISESAFEGSAFHYEPEEEGDDLDEDYVA